MTWSLLQVVYVCRDPRDVCISYYFHSIKLDGYRGELSDFVDLFLGDMREYTSSTVKSFVSFYILVLQYKRLMFILLLHLFDPLPVFR